MQTEIEWHQEGAGSYCGYGDEELRRLLTSQKQWAPSKTDVNIYSIMTMNVFELIVPLKKDKEIMP